MIWSERRYEKHYYDEQTREPANMVKLEEHVHSNHYLNWSGFNPKLEDIKRNLFH